MKVLLDTHVYLWSIDSIESLSPRARAIISDPEVEKILSAASTWEIGIKLGLEKLKLGFDVEQKLTEQLDAGVLTVWPVTTGHGLAVQRIQRFHKDPFDLLLVAIARMESIPILSADAQLDAYGVQRIW